MIKNVCKVGGLILAAAILLSACGTPQVTLPTADLNLVRTEAVQTAVAQMTREALLVQPTTTTQTTVTAATPSPMTATATSSILSGGSSGGGGGSGGSSSGGSSGGTAIPTSTPVIYKAQFISQNYPDGYYCPTGQEIDYVVTLKNIGAATWDTTYYYKMLNETEQIAKNTLYFLPQNVVSGGKVNLVVDVQCPKYVGGIHTTEWGLVNDNGQVFARFWFGFYTVVHTPIVPTPTRTQSPG